MDVFFSALRVSELKFQQITDWQYVTLQRDARQKSTTGNRGVRNSGALDGTAAMEGAVEDGTREAG